MFLILASALIAQSSSPPAEPEIVTVPQEIRALPGQLDQTLVFNSNSPEVVQTEGILLSTFPPQGMDFPGAHLDQAFNGRFDLFAHHIAKALSPEDLRTLYLGVMVHNPSDTPVKLDVIQAASYLSQPDAPFLKLDAMLDNPVGKIYAGPGDRVTNDVLRGRRQDSWPTTLAIPAKGYQMLLNVPIPVKEYEPPINGRSTLARLRSNGPVHMASLAMFGKSIGTDQAPSLDDWRILLESGNVSGPRDKAPTKPGAPGSLIYGRVAGVARGSMWNANIFDPQSLDYTLAIPAPGEAYSYPLSTVDRGTFGTGQIQSAKLLKRYDDTAYAAHGNYGIEYRLNLPLKNETDQAQRVSVTFQTALKTDELKAGLEFRNPPANRTFYRGTVRVRYQDSFGTPRTKYTHLVQLQGEQSKPLVTLDLEPQQKSLVKVDFIYPPDSTPPQVLTIRSDSKKAGTPALF